jgi:16S rRNA (uracil1498-N3)-methyltransferase
MPKIFLLETELESGLLTIRDEKARYLSTILRCGRGDHLLIKDSRGNSYLSKITGVTKKEVTVEILEKQNFDPEPFFHISLLQGLLKGEKMDLVVQKSTELGVKEIIPVVTERSQIRETRKVSRWKKIAEEASRQSGRNMIPSICEPIEIRKLFTTSRVSGGGIIFWEQKGGSFRETIKKFSGRTQIALFTGPEGGFSEKEIETASQHSFFTASLGKRILRAETAALAAVSIVQYEMGDIGA